MAKVFIKDLVEKENVHTCFLVGNKSVLTDKNGKHFMSLQLNDKTGSIGGMLWDKVNDLDKLFQTGDIVKVKGHLQVYQNRQQFVVHNIGPAGDDEYKIEDFVKASSEKPEEMFTQLLQIVDQVKNDNIRQLLQMTINDPETKSRLLEFPAAKSIHHAYLGGLLEHILSICNTMKFMAKQYPKANEDLLIFGAIYHDIGKLWELSVDKGYQYTDKGRLVGHMQIACEMISEKSATILGFTPELRDILKHIILSHHGRLEYGSPKRPKFLEALIVAMIDELDSRINSVSEFMSAESQAGEPSWTRYSQQYDRYFFLDIKKHL